MNVLQVSSTGMGGFKLKQSTVREGMDIFRMFNMFLTLLLIAYINYL